MSPSTLLPEHEPETEYQKDVSKSVPVVQLKEFDSSSASTDDIVQALIVDGGCYIRNFVSPEDLATIEREVRPFIDFDSPWTPNDFFPKQTRRVTGLLGKSQTFAYKIPGNKIYRDVCDVLLSSSTEIWVGEHQETHISKPQLNNTIVFSIGPGARAQELHRDDIVHHNNNVAIKAEDYKIGNNREVSVGCFVGGSKTTKANGATRFIPGSHLWARDQKPDDSMSVYAELNKGDAFIMLSSCYHAGSANTTQNEERLVFSCFLTKGYLRQEENQYLAVPLEKMKEYTVDMQKLAGYEASIPYCGWVNLDDPRKCLMSEAEKGEGVDLFAH